MSEFRAVVAQRARRKGQEVQPMRVAEESAAEVEQEPSPFQSADGLCQVKFSQDCWGSGGLMGQATRSTTSFQV